ncbi:MAG: hypothetical protein ABR613_09420 [Actinomycetota bacterium]
MLRDFYEVGANASFTLLGLWWIVVQARRAEWRGRPERRRAAFAISLQFALPGMMSLLSLLDPESEALWRASFGIAAVAGAIGLVVLQRGPEPMFRRATVAKAAYLVAIALYVCVALVALLAGLLKDAGIQPRQLDAALLACLLFVGLCIAWLVFDE